MAGYNRLIMIGNLTRDPDYKQLTSGQAVCRLGLASNRQFRNKQTSALVQEVCYVDIDVWGAQAESCRQYLQKGRSVLVEGRLKFDTWEDGNGQTRSKHSIVADRVVFLSNNAASDETTGVKAEAPDAGQSGRFDPYNAKEKEILDQIEQIKTKTTQKTSTGQENTEGVAFTDEPPFQDDLPF